MSLSFVHRWTPPSKGDRRTLLLLHGTGGDENDLVPLANMLAPTAGVLSPRGKVLEHGAPRFFRRLAEGVFDLEDLKVRTGELVSFVHDAARDYGFDAQQVVAVGFSNGANIAASVLLSHPGVFRGAILFRPMVPFEPAAAVNLASTCVLVAAGRTDPLVPRKQTERLIELLTSGGAAVTAVWSEGGHGLTSADVTAAADWLGSTVPPDRSAP